MNTCGSSVAAGANCQISVTFTPASAGALSAALTITDNAPNSPQTVSLSGTGVPPASIGAASGGSTSATVSSGGTATYGLSLTGAAGASGSASLSCSGAPQYAACTVNPVSVNLGAGSSTNFTVTVATTTAASAAAMHNADARLAGLGIGALLLVPLLLQIRKTRRGSLFLATICLVVISSGCGGGGGSSQAPVQEVTPVGTYTLTVTATTPNTTVQQSLTLIVH